MKNTVFVYKNCSTCKKALDWLDGRGNDIYPRDLVGETPTQNELRDLWKRSGADLNRFFNTSGGSYRDGGYKDRLPKMSDDDKLDALAKDGMLIKRPILATGKGVATPGFDQDEWSKLV